MSQITFPAIWGGEQAIANRVSVLEGKNVRTTRFASISSTSGTVTLPPNSVVILNDLGGDGIDAVVSTLGAISGRPTYQPAVDGGGNVVDATFNSSGVYTLSATPSAFPIGIIYRVEQPLGLFDSTATDIIGGIEVYSSGGSSGANIKAGFSALSDFSGSPKKCVVTFSSPFSDADYSIDICGTDTRNWSWESKTANGFTINSNASQVLTGDVDWQATERTQ